MKNELTIANFFSGSLIRRTISAVIVVVSAVTAPGAQTPPPQNPPAPPAPTTVTGKWTVTLEMQMGTAAPTLELVQAAEKITGTYEGRYGKFPLKGTLKKNVIEFSFTMNAEGTDVVMSYRGEVAADFQTMKGTADLEGMGEATWFAKRAK